MSVSGVKKHTLFYNQHFYKQDQAKISKKLSKSFATPWGETLNKYIQKRQDYMINCNEKDYGKIDHINKT